MALFLQKLYVIGIKRDRKTSRLPGLTKLFFSYYVCITGILPFLFFILHFLPFETNSEFAVGWGCRGCKVII